MVSQRVTDGGTVVTEQEGRLASGGNRGTSGGLFTGRLRPGMLTFAIFLGVGLLYMAVNAASLIDERKALGEPVEAWRAWVWEATSLAGWLVLLPAILWFVRRVPLDNLLRSIPLHLLATVPVSLAHTAALFGLRSAAFALVGERYRIAGPVVEVLLYEYRKDLITYASIVLVYSLLSRLVNSGQDGVQIASKKLVEVRDGSRVIWLKPEEVDWVAAAGNYVELNGSFGAQLCRRTLAEIEAELEPEGFARIHRSRLVRRAAVSRIETLQSGDFEVVLRSGETLRGSRRFRKGLS